MYAGLGLLSQMPLTILEMVYTLSAEKKAFELRRMIMLDEMLITAHADKTLWDIQTFVVFLWRLFYHSYCKPSIELTGSKQEMAF